MSASPYPYSARSRGCYNGLVRFLVLAFALLACLPSAASTAVAREPVRVIVAAEPGQADAATAAARKLGGTVEARRGRFVQVRLPASSVHALDTNAAVSSVQPPLLHVPSEVTGQEVSASGVEGLQASGVTGKGVSIAIIDVGFAGAGQAIANGELPANTDIGAGGVSFCGPGDSTSHGTAVAELAHDMAPDAHLYLLCIDSELTLSLALDYVINNHIPIISHSINWFADGRGDGVHNRLDRISPDDLVKKAYDHGILWINAAGNFAQSHWSGPSAHHGTSPWQDFGAGDEGNNFSIPAGSTGCAALTWDDWPQSDQDFDLFIFQTGSGRELASSENIQRPGQVATPAEEACASNTTSSPMSVYASIKSLPPAATNRLDLFVTSGTLKYSVPQGSIAEPAESPWAVGVGAVCWLGNGIRPYSSQGPTIDGRVKPDLVGYDGVSTATGGLSANCSGGFLGTSAATPEVSGAAALILQQQPGLVGNPGQAMNVLESRTAHLGISGRNNLFGSGRLCFTNCAAAPPPAPPPPPPPPLRITKLVTVPAHSRAGKPLDAKAAVVRTDTGARIRSGSVSCTARIGNVRLRVREADFRNAAATCSWSVPRSAAGKTLRATVLVTFEGATASRSFSQRVRQSG